MRVLQLIDSLDTGGAERMAVNLANALSNQVEESYLCATRAEGLLKTSIYPAVGYMFLKKRSAIDLGALFRLYRFVRAEQISIIHAHSSSFFLATLVKVFHPKITLIWHDHYGNSEQLANRPYKILQFCSRFFDMTFCVNTALVAWNRTHIKNSQIQFLSNFVIPSTERDKVTTLHGSDGKRILCLANLRPQKDHLTLLKAYKKIHALYPDWTLHLVGKDFIDEYSFLIKQYIKEQHLDSSVFLYGSKADTEYIMSQCDIGVLSSISEGLPLSLIEYGFEGLAVVATDVGDCRRIIKDYNVGILVKLNDIDAMSDSLIYYIENIDIRANVGYNLQTFVQHQFSKEAIIESLMLTYKQILSH